MPEPRITICPTCGWNFDLVVYATCPNCRTNKQRKQSQSQRRTEVMRGIAAEADVERNAKRILSVLYLVGLYLFGAVSYMMIMNHLMGKPLLSTPVIEKVQTVTIRPSEKHEEKKMESSAAAPPAKTVVDVRTTLEDEVASMLDWTRGDSAAGKVHYSGRVQNIGPSTLTSVTLKIIGKNETGAEVASAFVRVLPYTLQPLEIGKFDLDLSEDKRIRTVAMRVFWGQSFEKDVATAAFDEKASPPSAPGAKPGATSLILKTAGGGEPVVLTAEGVQRDMPGQGQKGPPPNQSVAEFRKMMEERRKTFDARAGAAQAPAETPSGPSGRGSSPPATGTAGAGSRTPTPVPRSPGG